MMPPLAEWGSEVFTAAKNAVKERFALSNTQFSKAIDAIKGNREFYGMIGGETDLPCLDDEVRRHRPEPTYRKPWFFRWSSLFETRMVKTIRR
jgi:hypothetical protein